MRALALLIALCTSGSLHAGLTNSILSGPPSVIAMQTATMVFRVSNNSSVNTVYDVSPTLGVNPSGFNPSVSGPFPASLTLTPNSSGDFTWYFNGTGCGYTDFSAAASGTENGNAVASNLATYQVTLYCTPTPTPTVTPVLTPTATPWVVTAPREGSARILGNIFRPLQGRPLVLEAELPENAILRIDLYDRLGHKVKGFAFEAGPGPVSVSWDGRSDDGLMVASGIYVAQFKARGFSRAVKFAVVK